MRSEKQLREHAKKQRELNALNRAKKQHEAKRLLNSARPADYGLGVKVVGKIELPPEFMKPGREKKAKKSKGAKATGTSITILGQLMKQANGKCYYCGVTCKRIPHRPGIQTPAAAASVEHLYPIGDIRRYLISDTAHTVLACYRCNQKSNDRFIKWKNEGQSKWRPSIIDLLNNQPCPGIIGTTTMRKVIITTVKSGKYKGQFRYKFIADNGEPLSEKETYHNLKDCTDVLKKYFPGFKVEKKF